MTTTSRIRRRSVSLLFAMFALAATSCDPGRSIGSADEDEDECHRPCNVYDGPDRVPADSIRIVQRDTTITLGDSLLVRINVYPDSATLVVWPEPLISVYASWMPREGPNTHVLKVIPTEARVIWLRATDTFAKGDTMELFVVPPAP